jgi:uracil-DNA glycosylase family 4
MDLNLNINLQSGTVEVPNVFPTFPSGEKLAVIGEAPGETEVEEMKPFVGRSGNFLTNALAAAGINRQACYVGNLCQERPPNNNFNAFEWHGPQITKGINQLRTDLAKFDPNLVLLCGAQPLKAAGIYHTINEYRGTVFKCADPNSPFFNMKCLATFHPAFIMTSGWNFSPLFYADLRRAKLQCADKSMPQLKRKFEIHPTADFIISEFERMRKNKKKVALDIEGVYPTITCISFSDDPSYAFIVPMMEFNPDDEVKVIRAMAAFLQDPEVPKVLQNGLYDAWTIARCYSILIRNFTDDTMLSAWEISPESPKSLGLQASIFTYQPFYKFDRKSDDRNTHFRYCCTDSAVTLEIANVHEQIMSPKARQHYKHNVGLLRPLLYIELRGINYDHVAAKEEHAKIITKLKEINTRIDARAGWSVNVGSWQQVRKLIYDQIGLPVQYKREGGRRTNKVTSDEQALLDLFKDYNDTILTDLLRYRAFDKRRQFCELGFDDDGRIRSSYNLVGTETGRTSSSKNLAGTGFNLQTIPKRFRKHFRADDDHWFFQCDLSGADGWTVAAWAAQLGDSTMLEDLQYGMKPAKILALLYEHGQDINKMSREQLKDLTKTINENSWLYPAAKACQHSSCYGAGARKTSDIILRNAYKKDGTLLYVEPKDCKYLQDLFLRARYIGVARWQNKIRQIITSARGFPQLPCASGHVRTFYGRKTDHGTYAAALSHEPQANTTYATNLALENLWNDPENRRPDGSLIIEPLHHVHDAICGQFPKVSTPWAIEKIRSYFNNTLTIAGLDIVIPFDGEYGPSWGEMNVGTI